MPKKKKDAWLPPAIDGKMQKGHTYRAFISKYTSKEMAAKIFKDDYGIEPEVIFIGSPNGSMIYAGPVPGLSDNDGTEAAL